MSVYDYIKPTKSSIKSSNTFYTVAEPLAIDAGAVAKDMLTTQITTQQYPDVVCPSNNTYDTISSITNSNKYASSVTSLLQGKSHDEQVAIAISVSPYAGHILPTLVPLGLRTENAISRKSELDGTDFWWEKGVQS